MKHMARNINHCHWFYLKIFCETIVSGVVYRRTNLVQCGRISLPLKKYKGDQLQG